MFERGYEMKKTRILTAVMAIVMVVAVFTGCKKEPAAPWQEQAKTLVAAQMDDTNVGKFVIDGVSFDFPMPVSDLLNHGWTFEYDTTGSTVVQPYTWHTSYINLKSADNKSIEIAVYNNTNSAVEISAATVGEVRVSNLTGKSMISGRIDFYGTTFDANGKLGDHAAAGFELVPDDLGRDNVFTKEFVGSNGKNCTATFFFSEYNGNIVLGEVKYECSFKISYVDAASGMIIAVTKNDPSAVTDLDGTINGDGFVKEMRQLVAESFVYALGFDFETLTDEQYEQVYAIMDAVYAHTQFSVQDKGYNTLIAFNAPTNIEEVMESAFEAASEEYEGDLDECMSDPEYLSLVLANFNTDAFEFMPGRDVLVTNDDFANGIITALFYMLGFAE